MEPFSADFSLVKLFNRAQDQELTGMRGKALADAIHEFVHAVPGTNPHAMTPRLQTALEPFDIVGMRVGKKPSWRHFLGALRRVAIDCLQQADGVVVARQM